MCGRVPGVAIAEEIEHHGARPDHTDRVGDILAIDIGGGTVHRFKD
jgi:hypothetical protein